MGNFEKYLGKIRADLRSDLCSAFATQQYIFVNLVKEVGFTIWSLPSVTASIDEIVIKFFELCEGETRNTMLTLFNKLAAEKPGFESFSIAEQLLQIDIAPSTKALALTSSFVERPGYLYNPDMDGFVVRIRKLLIRGENGSRDLRRESINLFMPRIIAMVRDIFLPIPYLLADEKYYTFQISDSDDLYYDREVKGKIVITEDTFKNYWKHEYQDLDRADNTFNFVVTDHEVECPENSHGSIYMYNGIPGRHAIFSIHKNVSEPSKIRSYLNRDNGSRNEIIQILEYLRFSVFLLRNLMRSIIATSYFSNLHSKGEGPNTCLLSNVGNTSDEVYDWILNNLDFTLCVNCRKAIIEVMREKSERAAMLKTYLHFIDHARITLSKKRDILANNLTLPIKITRKERRYRSR